MSFQVRFYLVGDAGTAGALDQILGTSTDLPERASCGHGPAGRPVALARLRPPRHRRSCLQSTAPVHGLSFQPNSNGLQA